MKVVLRNGVVGSCYHQFLSITSGCISETEGIQLVPIATCQLLDNIIGNGQIVSINYSAIEEIQTNARGKCSVKSAGEPFGCLYSVNSFVAVHPYIYMSRDTNPGFPEELF